MLIIAIPTMVSNLNKKISLKKNYKQTATQSFKNTFLKDTETDSVMFVIWNHFLSKFISTTS